ncbi:DUF6053 domain-containing protein [Lysobacter enzymogenes]|uniref:DUF6053 domain-containing protein n=1 Tax=Lysobacter enzymogenes TaxID=69 RepID=UPI003CCE4065
MRVRGSGYQSVGAEAPPTKARRASSQAAVVGGALAPTLSYPMRQRYRNPPHSPSGPSL